MGVFRVCQLFGRYVGDLNKVVAIRYFQLPNSDGKIQFPVENTTGTVFIQNIDDCVTDSGNFQKKQPLYGNLKPQMPALPISKEERSSVRFKENKKIL